MVFSKVGAELNDGVGDSRDAAEGSFDFGGFETDAVELDLVIDTTEEVELSVVVEAYQVAGSVEALTGAGGVREEAFGGKGRPVEVAAGNALATDIEFAGCACWDGPLPRPGRTSPASRPRPGSTSTDRASRSASCSSW